MRGALDQAAGHDLRQLLGIVGDAAPRAAQREAGTGNERIAQLTRDIEPRGQIAHLHAAGDLQADLLHRRFEERTILGQLNRLKRGTDQLHPVTVKDTCFREGNG